MIPESLQVGSIEIICGPMFSGKTEELLRRLRRAQIAKQVIQVFKPNIDNRYSDKDVVSHSEQREKAVPVSNPTHILEMVGSQTQVVGVDEAQFFSLDIVRVVETLAVMKKRVIIAGLDTDCFRKPFGPMPQLLTASDYVTKLMAICVLCGNPASFTQRTSKSTEQILVGAGDAYEARCRSCYEPLSDSHCSVV